MINKTKKKGIEIFYWKNGNKKEMCISGGS